MKAQIQSADLLSHYLGSSEALYFHFFGVPTPSHYTYNQKFRGPLVQLRALFTRKFKVLTARFDDFSDNEFYFLDEKNRLLIHNAEWQTRILFDYSNKKSRTAAENLNKELLELSLIIDARPKEGDSNISVLIKDEDMGLRFSTIKIPKRQSDINLNYTDDFKVKFEATKKFLLSTQQGLVLWRGKPGSGKTSAVKTLIAELTDQVQFVYIPPNILSEIAEPGFLTFLTAQKQEKNLVFIVEDAENAVKSRELTESTTSSVSNLLNLADGFLGDILNIKFICTLNAELTKIDSALLRKGRLRCEHEFAELPVDKVNALLKSLGKPEDAIKPMTLAQIYGLEEENFKVEKQEQTIGFKNLIK
jgi:hypothetical protein